MAKPSKIASELARARVQRMQGGGPGAWQATTVGLMLAGCVVGGFLIGAWLDARLGTAYWTPIIGLLGVVAGFREVVVTIGRLNQRQQREREARERERQQQQTSQPQGLQNRSQATAATGAGMQAASQAPQAGQAPAQAVTQAATQERARPRIFGVPPPPQPSFARQPGTGGMETAEAAGGAPFSGQEQQQRSEHELPDMAEQARQKEQDKENEEDEEALLALLSQMSPEDADENIANAGSAHASDINDKSKPDDRGDFATPR